MIKLYRSYKYDNRYDYTKLFSSTSAQSSYFQSLSKITISDDNYVKESPTTFKVPYNYDYLVAQGINYLSFNNGFKEIYGFIIKKEYVSEEVTRIIYETDVLQTYQFDITLKESFVERKVCEISEITDFDEGIEIGEHVITSSTKAFDKGEKYFAMFSGMREQQLIFDDKGNLSNVVQTPSATNKPQTIIDNIQYPLYFMELKSTYEAPTWEGVTPPTPGLPDTGVTGDWQSGIISAQGFRFVKGYEAYAPYEYQDPGGYWTIGYGVTAHAEADIYMQLATKQPVPEVNCAIVSYNLKNDRYGKKIVTSVVAMGITKQHQFDALCSLAFNAGTGVITGDNSLTRAIKGGNRDTIRTTWHKFYITSNGVELEGLKLRRIAEANIFLDATYEMRAIPKLNNTGTIIGTVTENSGNGWLPTGFDNPDGNAPSVFVDNALGSWLRPTTGTITALETYPSSGNYHGAVDIGNSLNTPVYASRGGTVYTADLGSSSYGRYVKLTHADGITSYYAHLNQVLVVNGQNVQTGQQIGRMGTTGNSTGVHLHWEIRNGAGTLIKPAPNAKVGDVWQ